MRTKLMIHLPTKPMRKFFDSKYAELRYLFGDDVVLQTLWQYYNDKEDLKEFRRTQNQVPVKPNS